MLFLFVVACQQSPPSPNPVETPPPAVHSPAPGPPRVHIGRGELFVNDIAIPSTLDANDERIITALAAALPAGSDALHIDVDTGVSWTPVRRVLLTGRQWGMGEFSLRYAENAPRERLRLIGMREQDAPSPTPQPIGLLHIRQGQQAWLEAELRFAGQRPVDCDEQYAPGSAHHSLCAEGQGQAVHDMGCLAQPMDAIAVPEAWPASLNAALLDLQANADWRWVLLVDTGVAMSVLDTVLAALQDTNPAAISLGGASATTTSPSDCNTPRMDSNSVANAAARWAGTTPPQ